MFSVVIPTLNRSEKLVRALRSVTEQNAETPEILVVDDGSTPDEAARIADHVAAVPNARLVVMPQNGGASNARNAGVAAATGEIIAFLDSDDWWEPERLSHHKPLFADPSVVFTWNSAHIMRGSNATGGRVGRPKPNGWSMTTSLAAWNFIGGCSLVCIRKSAFDAVGGFDDALPSCEDWDLYLRLVNKGEFRFLNETLGYYDAGPHERLTTSQQKIIDGHAKLHALAREFPTTALEKRYVAAMHHWTMSEVAMLFGEGARSRSELLASLRTYVTRIAMSRLPALLVRSLVPIRRKAG